MKKISLLIIIIAITLLCGCYKNKEYSYNKGEINVIYNDSKETYEIFVINENKTYYASLFNTEIKVANETDIVYKGGKLTFYYSLDDWRKLCSKK